MQTEIKNILEGMTSITLEEMRNIRLMDRIDTKFIAPASVLPELLKEMTPCFKVQVSSGHRMASYSTQYLDTGDMQMFLMHHNGRLNRQKIRIRTYCDSDLSFLEIKNKNNKGRTKKTRIQINQPSVNNMEELGENKKFLENNSLFNGDHLRPSLANNFKRITCVNNRLTERVTIDLHLKFSNYRTGGENILEDILILELKQDGWQHSDFRDILMHLRIKQSPFSKYCIGTVLTNPGIKNNRFKERIKSLQKISQI